MGKKMNCRVKSAHRQNIQELTCSLVLSSGRVMVAFICGSKFTSFSRMFGTLSSAMILISETTVNYLFINKIT